jgi:DNA-binding NarL/FixJ family response regulator
MAPPHAQCSEAVPPLNAGEVAVVRLVAQDLPNREIAKTLRISEKTVETRLKEACVKLKVRSRVGVAVFAALSGLVTDVPTQLL